MKYIEHMAHVELKSYLKCIVKGYVKASQGYSDAWILKGNATVVGQGAYPAARAVDWNNK